MQLSWLQAIINFLLGVLWTLLGVSTLAIFLATYHVGILYALVLSVFAVIAWLFVIILVEMANVQLHKLKELKKQTALLEEIKDKISDH